MLKLIPEYHFQKFNSTSCIFLFEEYHQMGQPINILKVKMFLEGFKF